MMNNEKHLIVLSGPSGSGKDTVTAKLVENHPEIEVSVSATSRAARDGEAEGVNYYYMDGDTFKAKITEGDILEYTNYCGNYYGTLKSEIDKRLTKGIDVILVIEVEGAANIRRLYPNAKLVFITPPSFEELETRLRGRGTDDEDAINKRLECAKREMALKEQYDYELINKEIDKCVEDFYDIIKS